MRLRALKGVGGLALLAAIAPAAHAQLHFTRDDARLASGCVHVQPPPLFFKNMAGGVMAGDFNRDGAQDLYLVTGNGPDRFLINDGTGTFRDEAIAWGVGDPHYGVGGCVGDYDGDGWLDIFVASVGDAIGGTRIGAHRLYRNLGAQGTDGFEQVALAAGVAFTSFATHDGWGSAFGDYDLDGDLDLFVCAWVNASGGNKLFINNGNGTFSDVTPTALAGIDLTFMHGFSPRFQDMDGDRYPELLLAADFGTSHYLVNNTDGTFTDATGPAGVGLDTNGMGHCVGDFNADGLLDWYVTSIAGTTASYPGIPGTGNMLYINQGAHVYTEESVARNVTDGRWGWGTDAADFDHDGKLDIVETNGWADGIWYTDPSFLYLNNGPDFTDHAATCNLVHADQGRGLAILDIENDGDMDVVIVTNDGPFALYVNELTSPNTGWLRVFLDTSAEPMLAPDGVGAIVRIEVAGMPDMMRPVGGGSTYLSQSELSAHFGVGAAATIDKLEVTWPNGRTSTKYNVPSDQTITIRYCPADWNVDNTVNDQDFFDWVNDFFSGAGPQGGSDFNQDGFENDQDWFDFTNAFFSGAC